MRRPSQRDHQGDEVTVEFYQDDGQPLRTRLMPGGKGYIIMNKRVWAKWRRWLP